MNIKELEIKELNDKIYCDNGIIFKSIHYKHFLISCDCGEKERLIISNEISPRK